MLMKITRGLGGRRGILILISTAVLGLALIVIAGQWRHRALAPTGIVATQLPTAQAVALGPKARGSCQQVGYMASDRARLASQTVARRPNGDWFSLPEGVILRVSKTEILNGETWVTGTIENGRSRGDIFVHASFLERYLPVVLDKVVELSDPRLLWVKEGAQPGQSVNGWLRNISSRTLSQCVVTCVFQDRNEREVDICRSQVLVLTPLELVRFETLRTDKPFAGIALQITFATPDGLRDYLSTVVIKRSSLQ